MSGEQAAVAAALAMVETEDEAEQLGLFAPAETEAGKEIELSFHRRPGRPPGARNKRTERTVAFLLSRHRDPREVLLEIAEANVADLAARLGCTLFEALQEKRLAAIGVLPYVAQRQPIAIDVTNRHAVYLTIKDADVTMVEQGAGVAARLIDQVELQEVSDDK